MQNPQQQKTGILRSIGHLPRNVIALGLVSLSNDASSEIIYPLLPVFLTTTLGAGTALVGLIEGLAESTSSLLKLPAGWISDRFRHRKRIVVAGYGTAALIRPLLALAATGWQVLGLRFIDRVGKGFRSAPRDAMIADAASAESRGLAFGFHRAMDHTGAIAGSLIAAALTGIYHQNLRSIFWWAAVPAFVGFLILVAFVREAKPAEAVQPEFSKPTVAWSLLGTEFRQFMVVLLIFTLSNSSDAFLLLRAQQAGIGLAGIPLLWAALHVSKSLSSIAGGSLADRFGKRRLLITGMLLYTMIYCGFAYFTSAQAVWILFLVYGIYFGLCEGNEKALVADLVPKEIRGTAFGMYNLVVGIAALPASLFLGWAWQRFGASAALLISAGISLASVLLFATFIFLNQNRKGTHEAGSRQS